MGAGLHFCFLDSIKAALERRRPDSIDAFLAGGLSRAGAAIISCPVTVVKTRMEYGGPGGTQYKVIAHWLARSRASLWNVSQIGLCLVKCSMAV
jgi:solute carrier family 25 protein 38